MSPLRFFRLALLLYPPSFRRDFGPQMLAFLADRSRRASESALWSFMLRDVARSLTAEWLDVWRRALTPFRRRPIPLTYPELAPRSLRRGVFDMVAPFFRDIRFALRNLRRTPGFTVLAVTTLALGVGANTAIFSVVNGVILRPLPYHDPDRLVMVQAYYPSVGETSNSHSQPDIHDIQREVTSLAASAGYTTGTFTLTGGDQPEVVRAARLTNSLLEVFQEAPVLGRDIRAEENVPGAPLVVVIGHAFWQERYGGDPGVIGRTIQLSEQTYEIVGVAPPEFDYPAGAQFWAPRYHDESGCARGCHFLRLVARLAPTATLASAQAELTALGTRLEEAYPQTNTDMNFRLVTMADSVYGDVRTGLYVMLGAVGVVLLIACANVANLLLVRGASRTSEIAVRAALGAGRGRLVGQLMMESLVLAVAGGALGVLLAGVGLGSLLRLAPSNLLRLDEIAVDGTVLAFALGTVTAVTLLFGLVPALRLARTSVAETLNHSSRGEMGSAPGGRSRSALLVGEVALSLVLLFGAGLLLRSFAELTSVPLGFDKENVLTFIISLPDARYGPDESVVFFERLESDLRGIPGVVAAGGALGSPMGRSNVGGSFELLDRPAPPPGMEPSAAVRSVTMGYLETLGVPILRGRGFEPSDRVDARPVAIVSQAFADLHYPTKDPLGQQLDLHVSFGYSNDEPHTIVGVAADTRSRNPRTEPVPEMYVVEAQSGTDFNRMLVRTGPGAGPVLPAIREVVQRLDANIPVRSVETLDDAVERAFGPARFYLVLLTVFAGLAVLLAAIGLYGVVSYSISRRRREIGIRIALGAEGRDVVRMVLRQGMGPAALGILLGLLGAWGGSRVLASLLYNVTPGDPVTIGGATMALLAVVAVAILIPARRASAVAPVVALKGE